MPIHDIALTTPAAPPASRGMACAGRPTEKQFMALLKKAHLNREGAKNAKKTTRILCALCIFAVNLVFLQ
ncbi:MAG: hypothetical protein HYU43_06915 [Armatimonadetes bacterium]|nr:hypothetical protein [Armatimonadota bacterium]